MEPLKISIKQRKRRSLLLVLPLLVVPFLTMAFWSMGGGKGQGSTPIVKAGLNTALPAARFSNETDKDKMALYLQADRDSLAKMDEQQKDPFFKMAMAIPVGDSLPSFDGEENGKPDGPAVNMNGYKDPNEEKVLRKISELNKALNESVVERPSAAEPVALHSSEEQNTQGLEAMMGTVKDSDKAADSQMQQMETMLDKILDIQHPDRAAAKTKDLSLKNRQQVYPVNTVTEESPVSLLGSKVPVVHRTTLMVEGEKDSFEIPVVSFGDDSIADNKNEIQANALKAPGFYGLDETVAEEDESPNSLEAVIPETQTLVSGATLKLQLLNDCYIGGTLVHSGKFLYGQVSLNGERLEVIIPSLKAGKNILPVSLSVYDMDGLAGIYMPGAISRDVSKESAEQAIQAVNVMSYDPSLAAQATGAGIQAAKALLSKKVKLIRVTVKAGYRVMLRDNKQNM